MCHEGDICLVSPATVAALDALLLLAVQKASEVIASGALEPKDAVAAVKVIAEATKAASEAVSKGNGITPPAPSPTHHASSDTSPANGPPIYTLNDAVAAVCERDADTKALVPWARVICRMHRLCNMVEEQIAEVRGEPMPDTPHKSEDEMAEELAEKYDVPFSPSRMPAYKKKLADYEREKKARLKAQRAARRAAKNVACDDDEFADVEDASYSDYQDEYLDMERTNHPEDRYPDVGYSKEDNCDAAVDNCAIAANNHPAEFPTKEQIKESHRNVLRVLNSSERFVPT